MGAGLLSSHLFPSQQGRRQLLNKKPDSTLAGAGPKGMSLGEAQSQGWAGESLVQTGWTSCWNLQPTYHILHPALPAPICPSAPDLGCLCSAGWQLLQYHQWDKTLGQTTSSLSTQRAWSLMSLWALARLPVFSPLSTRSKILRGQGTTWIPKWSCWHPLTQMHGPGSVHICTSVKQKKKVVLSPSLQVRVNWISFFNSLPFSKAANDSEPPAGVTQQSICLEEEWSPTLAEITSLKGASKPCSSKSPLKRRA